MGGARELEEGGGGGEGWGCWGGEGSFGGVVGWRAWGWWAVVGRCFVCFFLISFGAAVWGFGDWMDLLRGGRGGVCALSAHVSKSLRR